MTFTWRPLQSTRTHVFSTKQHTRKNMAEMIENKKGGKLGRKEKGRKMQQLQVVVVDLQPLHLPFSVSGCIQDE